MILGFSFGLILHNMELQDYAYYIKPVGDIFLRLLQMIIVPLVFSSVFMSVVGLGGPKMLNLMGRTTLLYYFTTTAVAVLLGILVVNVIQPGVEGGIITQGVGFAQLSEDLIEKVMSNKGLLDTIIGVVTNAIPSNIFTALTNTGILQIIFFSVILGITAIHVPEKAAPVVSFLQSVESMSVTIIWAVMKIAPIGIFALIVDVMAHAGFDAITSLAKYISTILVGLFLHTIFLLLVGFSRSKISPFTILKKMTTPLMTAASTCSSVATLPITMTTVEKNFGVRKNTSKFVLPLGATINMDGTALYESVAAIFIAQAYGIELSLLQQATIFITASIAAVGAAAIPGAGLITMSIVLTSVGLPLKGIGLILAVDRFLDMFRTSVNVLGDCMGCLVVDSFTKKSSKHS